MSVSEKLISNTVYLFLDWLILTSMGFLYWSIAGKTLLPEEYGIVSTSVNLAIVLSGVSLLGLNTATWKLIPEYLAKKQKGKINSLIRFSLKVILISNLFFVLVLFSFSSFFQSILKTPLIAIWLTAITLFIISLSTQFGTIIYGFQDMKIFLETDWWGQLAKVSISTILIFFGLGYLGPLVGFLIGFLVITLLRFFFIPFKGMLGKINKKKIFFDYALPTFIANLAWIIFLNGQYVLLTILKNPETTGIFTIAMILTYPITVIPQTLTSALLPITSQLSIDRNSKKKVSHLIELVFRYALFLALPVALFLMLFSKPIILIFSRVEYLPASQLFPILALSSVVYGLGNVFLYNLYAIGKIKINRNIVIVTTFLFFIFAVPLILVFSALGLAIAYILATTILTLLSFYYIRKNLEVKLVWGSIGKLILASLISFSFLYVTTSFTSGLLAGIFLTIIAGLIYIEVLILLKFYIKEDVIILEFFASKSPLFKKQILFLAKFISRFT
ncbi:MAG: oligosaccharide flippase family protein [Candidatus Aenigmatarchaeota archaeon]